MDTKTRSTRVLRMKDLPPKIGLRPSTIYELIAVGRFPISFKLIPGGRASGWLESTIDAWLHERSTDGATHDPPPRKNLPRPVGPYIPSTQTPSKILRT